MRGTLAVLLILAIAAAGCVGQDDVVKGQTEVKVVEAGSDLIAVSSPVINPFPPIITESPFRIQFTATNTEKPEKAKELGAVSVWITDTGVCTLDKIRGGNAADLKVGSIYPGFVIKTSDGNKFSTVLRPGAQEIVDLDLTSPAKERIAGLTASCAIDYKLNFTTKAVTSMDTQVIDPVYRRTLEGAGKPPQFSPTENIDSGPLKIYFADSATPIAGALPLESKRNMVFFLWVENKGQGIYGSIKPGQLKLKVLAEFDWNPNKGACDKFSASKERGTGTDQNNWILTNNEELVFSAKKTPKLQCKFIMPTVEEGTSKKFFMSAEMEYNYEMRGSVPVSIKPAV